MINGIDYLKGMYPNRDDKDYQPSGMDLRLGNIYGFVFDKEEKYGLIELDLKGFETYSQFNNYDYTKTQKEGYKNHVLDIINGKAKNRKSNS